MMTKAKATVNKIISHPAILTAIRVAVGVIFLLFGIGKATELKEQFYASINQYQMLPEQIVPFFGTALVYLEIVLAILLILGIFTRLATWGISALLIMFIIAIGQAMLRGLDLPDCGCSGGLLKLGESPGEVLLRDFLMLAGMAWLLIKKSTAWTVDSMFERKK